MFVDHMHQPWRTLAAIINKCLSGKTASNNKLRKSRIDILWGMFNRENVDYLELIWEDFAYQIDHRKEKRSRRKNMPYPRFTKIIINHFLKQHKSLTNLNHKHFHTIKDDGIVSRLKFVRISEDYQEYGLYIPNVMLTDAIKHSESYHMLSKNQITPKKSRGKGSKGKNTAKESQETVDVSKESEPEPEPAKKKTSGKRRVTKKVTLSADDNIISDDPDAALELAKSISQTEAEKAEAARKVHATHVRIMTESIPESAKKKSHGRSSKSVVIQDTISTPKSKPTTSKTKLKGASSLTLQEQETVNIMQALKESKKTSKRQLGTGGLNEGTCTILGVLDESTVISATSSEGTGAKPGVLDEEKDITKEKDDKDGDADDEGDDHISDTQDADDEDVEIESDEDEIYKYKIRVRKDEDAEMKDVEVEESDKAEEKLVLLRILQIQIVAKLEKDMSKLKILDHYSEALVVLQSQVPTVVDSYLDTKVRDVFQKELQKLIADLIHKYSLQHLPELTKKLTIIV
ncbi:hypothetical protein Tco_1009452 [Tanacetum coccineum]